MDNLLPLIWAFIIAFGVMMYVLLDGFDLGIGILFLWIPESTDRDIMMNSIAPLWDGNETWLILGGAALYGAFPLAYSSLLPQLYIPILMMLASLILRGVAFEFRFKAHQSRFLWDYAFAGGSMLAAFCQGIVLGAFVEGHLSGSMDYLSPYRWISPFSVMCGFGVMTGYALLGATWLIIKTEKKLQASMYNAAKMLLSLMVIFLIIVSLWTPFTDPHVYVRWFSLPNFFFLLPLPVITGFAILYCYRAIANRREKLPFLLSISLFVLSYAGLGISSWPYIIPHSVTIWQAASPPKSQLFLLVGTLILLPLLLAYTAYAYYVFRGKVQAHTGYHE